MENQKSIHQIVQEAESRYVTRQDKISEYVEFSQFDNINKIEAYINSKHISGDVDSKGREKPFFNIVVSATNIWYRATKRRLKDIKIRADKSANVLASTMATIIFRDWAKKAEFEKFIIQWGITLASYGSAVSKFVNTGKELKIRVVPWGTLITDSINFEDNPQIEKFYVKASELYTNKAYNQEEVERLTSTETTRKDMRGIEKNDDNSFIELYEVHGVFPLSFITDKEKDDETYVQQMHIISFRGDTNEKDAEVFTLAKGREDISPYILTNLIPDNTGQRATGKGAVELLFEAQWMRNHTTKLIKDQLDHASKIFYQTADVNFAGRNTTSDVDTGDILVNDGNRLEQVNNSSHDISSLQNYGQDWSNLSQALSSTPDAMRGESPVSGTAYRTQQLAVNESASLFEEMGYSKDIGIKEMMTLHIIPFIKTKMDTSEEISAILDDADISKIDAKFVKNSVNREVNKKLIEKIFESAEDPEATMPTMQDQEDMSIDKATEMQSQLSDLGNQRFFKPSDIESKTWKKSIDNFEWQVEIDTPSDQKEINLAMETLTNVFQTIANPATAQVLDTPRGKFIFNKILTIAGNVSPLELSDLESQQDSQIRQQTVQAQGQIDPSVTPQQPQMMA